MADRSDNVLVRPPFAANPPVKLNVDAKILGLVIAILALVAALLTLFAGGLLSLIGFAGGFAPIWLLGVLVALVAEVMAAVGGFQMFNGNRRGRNLVIYSLAIAAGGAVLAAVGQIIAYSGLILYSSAGPIVGLIIDLIIYGVLYYLVVISRFPDAVPQASLMGAAYGPPQQYGAPQQYAPPQQQQQYSGSAPYQGPPPQYPPPPPPSGA
ncbi:MAG TPA: hypothetical protein VEK76_09445 [Candidatus Binatia bacterium]|nr:hypothetical protein [Candidatus Binatia bacterium]